MPAKTRPAKRNPKSRSPGIIPPAGVRPKVTPAPVAYGPISTPKGTSRTAFLRGTLRNSGMMKGDPKPKVGAPGKGVVKNPRTAGVKGTVMKGTSNQGGWQASGNFSPRLGRR